MRTGARAGWQRSGGETAHRKIASSTPAEKNRSEKDKQSNASAEAAGRRL
jgi:hypothetical protein